MGFSRQEYWSGLPFPTPEDHPDPGIKPKSVGSPALAGGFFTTGANEKPSDSIVALYHTHGCVQNSEGEKNIINL